MGNNAHFQQYVQQHQQQQQPLMHPHLQQQQQPQFHQQQLQHHQAHEQTVARQFSNPISQSSSIIGRIDDSSGQHSVPLSNSSSCEQVTSTSDCFLLHGVIPSAPS